jgi:hypothetical protein
MFLFFYIIFQLYKRVYLTDHDKKNKKNGKLEQFFDKKNPLHRVRSVNPHCKFMLCRIIFYAV